MRIVVRIFIIWSFLITPTFGATIFSYVEKITTIPFGRDYRYVADYVVEWDYSDTTKNPCYLWKKCRVVPYLYKDGVFMGHVLADMQTVDSDYRPCIASSPTLGALGECLIGYTVRGATMIEGGEIAFSNPTHIPYRFYSTSIVNNLGGYCFKFTMMGQRSANVGSSDLGVIPSVCGIAPPPIGICSTPDSIDIDHGVVNSKFTSSTILSEQFNIECNQDMTATIILSGLKNGRLKLTDNLESELKINGYQADQTPNLNFKAGSNSINITSELINSGVITGGEYQAQAIMTLAIE